MCGLTYPRALSKRAEPAEKCNFYAGVTNMFVYKESCQALRGRARSTAHQALRKVSLLPMTGSIPCTAAWLPE